jgi:hypothetical protein
MVPATAVAEARGGDDDDLETGQADEGTAGEADEEQYIVRPLGPSSWKDGWFAVAFLLNVTGTVYLAVRWGSPAVVREASGRAPLSPSSASGAAGGSSSGKGRGGGGGDRFLEWFFLLLSTAVAWSLVALAILLATLIRAAAPRAITRSSERLVRAAFFAGPVLFWASALVLLAVRAAKGGGKHDMGPHLAASGSIFAALIAASWWDLRVRAPFAASTLRVAAEAVVPHLLYLVPISVASSVLGYVWFILSFLAFRGWEELWGYRGLRVSDSVWRTAAYLFSLLSIYWGWRVLSHILSFTAAGAVGSWWRRSHPLSRYTVIQDGRKAVGDSLLRACTCSLGSVCMASLLNGVADALQSLVHSSGSNNNNSRWTSHRQDRELDGTMGALLGRVTSSPLCGGLAYCNNFALVSCALHSTDYVASGRHVAHLFQRAGFTAFVGDVLVHRVVFTVVLAVAALTGLTALPVAAVLWTARDTPFDTGDLSLMFLIGFVFGFCTSYPIMILLETASRTVMACLAEAPSDFASSRPDLYEILAEGWSAAYPEAWREQKAVPQQ